jgi:hypothetical protein
MRGTSCRHVDPLPSIRKRACEWGQDVGVYHPRSRDHILQVMLARGTTPQLVYALFNQSLRLVRGRSRQRVRGLRQSLPALALAVMCGGILQNVYLEAV